MSSAFACVEALETYCIGAEKLAFVVVCIQLDGVRISYLPIIPALPGRPLTLKHGLFYLCIFNMRIHEYSPFYFSRKTRKKFKDFFVA